MLTIRIILVNGFGIEVFRGKKMSAFSKIRLYVKALKAGSGNRTFNMKLENYRKKNLFFHVTLKLNFIRP